MHKLITWNEAYILKILSFENKLLSVEGSIPYIVGQLDYNNIVKINSVFSLHPKFIPVDRTLSTKLPFNIVVPRPWKTPSTQRSLSDAMAARVHQILSTESKVNLMWSGGIDSTAMLSAFLQNCDNRSQLRIIYSPWSTYEHPEYFKLLQQFDNLDLVDISGERYLDWDFDGVVITGDGGDELMASIDESFLKTHGWESLHTSWQDFFYKKCPEDNFIEFCTQHFARSGREINTVLEARWWFYTSCKSRSILNTKYSLLFDLPDLDVNSVLGFYDSEEFESYIFWNIQDCMLTQDYASWKQVLKNYSMSFDGLDTWAKEKTKAHSIQPLLYSNKKLILKNQHWLALLSDGTREATPSLPVLTKLEYNKYTNLKWAFND